MYYYHIFRIIADTGLHFYDNWFGVGYKDMSLKWLESYVLYFYVIFSFSQAYIEFPIKVGCISKYLVVFMPTPYYCIRNWLFIIVARYTYHGAIELDKT